MIFTRKLLASQYYNLKIILPNYLWEWLYA